MSKERLLSKTDLSRIKPRLVEDRDVDQLVELVQKGMPGYPFEYVYDKESVSMDVNSKNVRRIVVEGDKGKLIGTAVLGDFGGNMLEIKRVVTLPEVRNKGVASEITAVLTKMARDENAIPWIDARGDQLGMQKASINSGYVALSLEKGKHCVYMHKDRADVDEVGPARETMVHFTSFLPNYFELRNQFISWPQDLAATLRNNMAESFNIPDKSASIVAKLLPSAAKVKQRISDRIQKTNGKCSIGNWEFMLTDNTDPYHDCSTISFGNAQLLVIKPDASGFFRNLDPNDPSLAGFLQLGLDLGLQTMTTYVDVKRTEAFDNLLKSGMEPTMIRLWQENKNDPVTWQVGWRRMGNEFQNCLHYLRIHNLVGPQIEKVINSIR